MCIVCAGVVLLYLSIPAVLGVHRKPPKKEKTFSCLICEEKKNLFNLVFGKIMDDVMILVPSAPSRFCHK